jgi:hypothetical protein
MCSVIYRLKASTFVATRMELGMMTDYKFNPSVLHKTFFV